MPRSTSSHGPRVNGPDPRLESLLRHAVAIGAVLVLLLPEARGSHVALGALPLWLLAMPLSAWWALHRFALPGWLPARTAAASLPRRSTRVQARRRPRPVRPLVLPRAA